MNIKTRHLLGFLKQLVEDIENGDVQGEEVEREYGFSGDDTAIEYRMFLRYVKKDS